jgi:peptidyl serine alpha-galactosyltransferase
MQRRKTGDDVAPTPTADRPFVSRTSSKLVKEKSPTAVWLAMGSLFIVAALGLYLMKGGRGDQYGFVDAPTIARRSHTGASEAGDRTLTEAIAAEKVSGGYEYHIVFSTGCSIYQDWQSYVFFHRAMVIGQPGTITRIVSGCDDKVSEEKITQIFNEQIRPMAPDRFKIHITPDFSMLENGKHFVYFNKPFGMKHWLENALGFPNNPINKDAIVILVDPDQLILRPFRNNDFTNTNWAFIPAGTTPYNKVEHGRPMGQLYGFGLQWRDKVNMTAIVPNSPVAKLSRKQAQAGYIVGPPYAATAQDMYQIVSTWCSFARPVYKQYPFLLAEMFAYCLGAAHEKLPHQTARSFMISDVFTGNMEGWSFVDKMPDKNVCGNFLEDEVPNVLHFCQRYGLGRFFFGKRIYQRISCRASLLFYESHQPISIRKRIGLYIQPETRRLGPKKWRKEMHLSFA